ncbi:type IV pilin protein [Thalassomonas sp. M1454]|uniref:type IV pilin protein n=1 Tax=Thalassomonas sp. M1454 TaxID=2594477 RepID=UPI00117CE459|nr:type IV pilin protein [Thalassomonas sp. M1454]TRX54579.1 prepilin-type N-terminal cleavage/methylation domain-containing protein [Thalassomonas sp. M1454]
MRLAVINNAITLVKQLAFSLIELLIVILILAILSAIVYPNYQHYVLKAHRSDAKSTLMKLAVAQEKFYNQNLSYSSDLISQDGLNNQTLLTVDKFYQLSVQVKYYNVDGQDSFTIKAQAINSQINDRDCRQLTINNLNQRNGYTEQGILNTKCWL